MDSWWQAVAATAAAEFSDVTDPVHVTRMLMRLTLAAALGFLLGFEREHSGKAAGARTHMLVALGAAMFVLSAQFYGIEVQDLGRVIQGVIAGVGFLCAGTILKHGPGVDQVRGLTTAAGLWMTAAIGVACGLGRETTALVGALFAFVVLALVPTAAEPSEQRNKARHGDRTRPQPRWPDKRPDQENTVE